MIKMRTLLPYILVAALLIADVATAVASEATFPGVLRGPSVFTLLQATTGDTLICTGESTDVFIDLNVVANLYGYQFQVNYDDNLVDADAEFLTSFFDVDGDGTVPGEPWNATCAGGTCSFAKSEVAPDAPVTGSGQLVKITLTGVMPGDFDVTIDNDILSDIDGNTLSHALGAPLPITVCSSPRLSARVPSGDTLICTGETTIVTIDLDCVANLYGYQFEVSYDDTLVSAEADFVNSFFDGDDDGSVPGGAGGPWDATCAGGTCSFAKSEVAPDPAASGSGQVARISLTGISPGAFNLAIGNDILSDIDGIALFHDVGAPLPINVCGLATISGYVTLQGRFGGNVDTGTVSMVEQSTANFGAFGPTTFSATDGAYSLQVPYMAGGTSYQILAKHSLYLDNQDIITVSGNLANKNTQLRGGDANNSGNISIADLSCIGGAFGESPVTTICGGPPPIPTGNPDINADGRVNIQDLSIAGGNYYKTSPQPW